jgi:hypothetical protein
MTHPVYRCAKCGEEFESEWTLEEACAEYEAIFNRPFNAAEVSALCDDCYEEELAAMAKPEGEPLQ